MFILKLTAIEGLGGVEMKRLLNNEEQDRQCTHNETLRRVRATIVVAENQ